MPFAFPWEIREEYAKKEAEKLRKKVKEQQQEIEELKNIIKSRKCID